MAKNPSRSERDVIGENLYKWIEAQDKKSFVLETAVASFIAEVLNSIAIDMGSTYRSGFLFYLGRFLKEDDASLLVSKLEEEEMLVFE